MKKSALQVARAAYKPKMPKALYAAVKVEEGAATQSVADQRDRQIGVVPARQNRAPARRLRRVIPAHCVNYNLHCPSP